MVLLGGVGLVQIAVFVRTVGPIASFVDGGLSLGQRKVLVLSRHGLVVLWVLELDVLVQRSLRSKNFNWKFTRRTLGSPQ